MAPFHKQCKKQNNNVDNLTSNTDQIQVHKIIKNKKRMSTHKSIVRACLLYEFKLGTKAAPAARRICAAFGEHAVSDRTAQKWFARFSSGDESLVDDPRLGRPKRIDDDTLRTCIESNPNQSCDMLAKQLNASGDGIRRRLHHLGKRYSAGKWVSSNSTKGKNNNGKKIDFKSSEDISEKSSNPPDMREKSYFHFLA